LTVVFGAAKPPADQSHCRDHRAQGQKLHARERRVDDVFYFDFDWRLLFDAVVVLLVDEMPMADAVLVGYAPLADEGGFVVDVLFVGTRSMFGISAPPAIACLACPRLCVDAGFVASPARTRLTVPSGSWFARYTTWVRGST